MKHVKAREGELSFSSRRPREAINKIVSHGCRIQEIVKKLRSRVWRVQSEGHEYCKVYALDGLAVGLLAGRTSRLRILWFVMNFIEMV